MSDDPVKIRLLDREFLVACSEDERAGLMAAADLLDQRMRELRNGSGNPGFDRIAVLVALRIAHDHINLKAVQQQRQEDIDASIVQLTRKLEQALAESSDKT